MSQAKKYFSIVEVCQFTGLKAETLSMYIEREWISPNQYISEMEGLDEEDLARLNLILELKRDFGVNDESVPLILHLVDQIHYLRNELIKASND
jgi:chaperone modulatory protein CbpM